MTADALDVFTPGCHVFVKFYAEPPTAFRCEVCLGDWDTLDDALDAKCERRA